MAIKLADVLKDAKLLEAAKDYAKRMHNEENILFIVECDKLSNDALYKKYIAKGAPMEVNLEASEVKPMRALADAKDFKNSDWKKLLAAALSTVEGLWKTNDGQKFESSPEYKAWVDANKPKVKANPAKAAKLLGIGDVDKLKKAMQAQIDGDDKTALKLFGEIAKEEKLKDKAEAIMKALEKAGLV